MNVEQIKAEYIDHMGSDLLVVNAARASFGKESQWDFDNPRDEYGNPALKPADAGLIRFLASGYRTSEWNEFLNEIIAMVELGGEKCKDELAATLKAYKRKAQHWAPFGHPHCTIRINLPIFLARQFVKHQVGGVWSEESRRYISDEPGVWFPEVWHTRPSDIKQGSGTPIAHQDAVTMGARRAVNTALDVYEQALDLDVAPEEARIVLPLNMMTTVVWTGSLLFWSRVVNQRVDSHAQLAAQELANKIGSIMQPLYPLSWKELTA